MGLFGGDKQTKEEKQAEEIQKFVDKYGLDELSLDDLKTVRRIADDLRANGLFKAGLALSFGKAEEQAKVTYLSALVEQNWLIINQLSRLNNNIQQITAIEK